MYVKKFNFVLYLALSLVIGFGLSFLLQSNDSQNGLLSGDISKATRYNNVKEDPEIAVIVEKLQNDTAVFNQTRQAVELINERTSSLAILSEETAKLCAAIPELEANVAAMNSLSAKAYNTSSAFNAVSSSLDLIAEGKKAPLYEQSSNNAFVGFQKIENQMDAGKTFVESASQYLSDKDLDGNNDLAGVVALWSYYCAEDAVMTGNEEDLKYWESVLANSEVAAQGFSATNIESCKKSVQNLFADQNIHGFINNNNVREGIQNNVQTTGTRGLQNNVQTTGTRDLQNNVQTTGTRGLQNNVQTNGVRELQNFSSVVSLRNMLKSSATVDLSRAVHNFCAATANDVTLQGIKAKGPGITTIDEGQGGFSFGTGTGQMNTVQNVSTKGLQNSNYVRER